jgi:hypothetical protein
MMARGDICPPSEAGPPVTGALAGVTVGEAVGEAETVGEGMGEGVGVGVCMAAATTTRPLMTAGWIWQ